MRRTWTPTETTLSNPRPVLRYDFGDYEGWLDGDVWRCWRILSTTRINESIIQEVEEMPIDFTPFRAYSIEVMQLTGTIDALHIPGWSISTSR